MFCVVYQANGGMLKEGDALSGELWEEKRDRIRRASIYGKLPGWDLRSVSATKSYTGYLLYCFFPMSTIL